MSEDDRLNMHRLSQYVNRASNLAESVQADIKDSGSISQKTVLALHEFQKAADRVRKMLVLFTESEDNFN